MSIARTWNLRLNMDEFNAAYGGLFQMEDKAMFLMGMFAGINNAVVGTGSGPLMVGFQLGQEMRKEAESFREMKKEVGSLGGRPKEIPIGKPSGYPSGIPEPNQEVSQLGNPNHNPQSLYPENDNPQINTPPSPKGVSSRKKLPRAPSWKTAFPDDVTDTVFAIMNIWADPKRDIQPKRCPADPTNSVPESHPRSLADRITAIQREGGDLNVCVEIAKEYIKDYRSGKLWVKAAENFFGKADDAPFKVYYPAYMTNLKLQEKELESESQSR